MGDIFKYSAAAELIRSLADNMDRQGFACLANCLSDDDLKQLRSLVCGAGLDPTGKYAVLQDKKPLARPLWRKYRLQRNSSFYAVSFLGCQSRARQQKEISTRSSAA